VSMTPEDQATMTSWEPRDRAELCSVWSELAPGQDEQKPRFRAKELVKNQAGYLFQRWVMQAFRLSQAEGDHSFRSTRQVSGQTLEELDGLVYSGWQGFLIESKFQEGRVDIDPILRLHIMAEQRPAGTLGLFFSVSGDTGPCLDLVDRLRPMRVLLFEELDLDWAVKVQNNMLEMVRRKWILALRTGRPHIPVTQFTPPFGGPDASSQHSIVSGEPG
jgi:hypothetical protein